MFNLLLFRFYLHLNSIFGSFDLDSEFTLTFDEDGTESLGLKDEAISNNFWSSSGGILLIISPAVLSMLGGRLGGAEPDLKLGSKGESLKVGFPPWSEDAILIIF